MDAPEAGLPSPEITTYPNSRKEVLGALQLGIKQLRSLPEDTISDETRWIRDSTLNAYDQAKRSRDYKIEFTDPSKLIRLPDSEGIPTEGLIKILQEQAAKLPVGSAKRTSLENAVLILGANSKSFEDQHGPLNDPLNPRTEERKRMEAHFITQDYRAQHKGMDQDWYDAEAVLRNRTELVVPPADAKTKAESAASSTDEVIEEVDKDTPPTDPDEPTEPPKPQTELEFAMVSGKQRIEHDQEGKTVAEMEVSEQLARQMGRGRMTEDREQYQGRLSAVRQLIPRFWKYTIGDAATYNKEKNHAFKMLAEAGVQMTTLPHDFLRKVDTLARTRVTEGRQNFGRRFLGRAQDFFREATFREKALHDQRLEVVRNLRLAAEGSTDPNIIKFAEDNPALLGEFKTVLTGDHAASEQLARRVSHNLGDELIHASIGERRTQNAITLSPEVANFYKSQIMEPLLKDGLQRGDGTIDATILAQARRKMQDFFVSPTFVKWYDGQPAEVQNSLKLSLSYGSDIIPAIQDVLLPQALLAREHLSSTGALDDYLKEVVLKVNVGTLEAGPKGVIEEGLAERAASRTITNRRVLELYQQMRQAGTAPTLVPDTYLNAATDRATILSQLGRLSTHQVLMGVGVGVGTYLATSGLNNAARVLMPVIGGSVVGGALRAAQERRLFTREREQYGVESELGYQDPVGARRREQQRRLEFHKRSMTQTTDTLNSHNLELKGGQEITEEHLLEMAGALADVRARFQIMDSRGMGLFAASGPQNYQVERTALEIARAEGAVAFHSFLNSNPDRLDALRNRLQIQNIPAGQNPAEAIMDTLSRAQIQHLETGAGISTELQASLGGLSIQQAESVQARDRAFQNARNRRMAVGFATGLGTGIVGGALFQEGYALFQRNVLGNEIAPTVVERALRGDNVTDWFNSEAPTQRRVGGFASDYAEQLRKNPGTTYELGNGFKVSADANQELKFFDITGREFQVPGARIDTNGHFLIDGKADQLDPTLLETLSAPGWTAEVKTDPNANIEKFKEVFKTGGRMELGDGLAMVAVPEENTDQRVNRMVSVMFFKDGNFVDVPPVHITQDGHFIVNGDVNNLPSEVKVALNGAEWRNFPNHTPLYNLQENIAGIIKDGVHETIMLGDTVVDVDGPKKTFSFIVGDARNAEIPKQQVHGFINEVGKLVIDRNFEANKNVDWSFVENHLKHDLWELGYEKTAGIPGTVGETSKGTVIDALLSLSPDQLKQQGIIETDQMKKTWNFHVLRPDIVDATGNHTHNELTMHLGGQYTVLNPDGSTTVRTGVGAPGILSTGSELTKGLINSNLAGVDPARDPVLASLIDRTPGGLTWDQMVAVVDLKDGRQIMLDFDTKGHLNLPKELYDPTSGQLKGIETISTAVLQKSDGTVLTSEELIRTGQIPQGSVVHSLASEKFASLNPDPAPGKPPVPGVPGKDLINLAPPPSTEYTPPADKTYLEFTPPPPEHMDVPPPPDAPAIPTPFGIRRPLESPEIPIFDDDKPKKKGGQFDDHGELNPQQQAELESATDEFVNQINPEGSMDTSNPEELRNDLHQAVDELPVDDTQKLQIQKIVNEELIPTSASPLIEQGIERGEVIDIFKRIFKITRETDLDALISLPVSPDEDLKSDLLPLLNELYPEEENRQRMSNLFLNIFQMDGELRESFARADNNARTWLLVFINDVANLSYRTG